MSLRQSNFELLRIIAILFVMILHADFYALSGPSADEIITNPIDSALRILFQAICIVAVNVFVMISGWFGINPSRKGFLNLLFQIFIYSIIVYIVAICTGYGSLSVDGIKSIFLATSSNWFIKAYILLYILSPVLNGFVENASKLVYLRVLVGFFIFQMIYGWFFSTSTDYIVGGYSPISFIGLYLLIRYVKIYKPKWTLWPVRIHILMWLVVIFSVTIVCITPPLVFGAKYSTIYGYNLLNYISPTTIIAALLMILITSKIQIENSLINRLASSSFAVYLVFVNPHILSVYGCCFRTLHHKYQGVSYWIIVLGIVIVLYMIVAFFDTVRLKIWKLIYPQRRTE